MGLALFFHKRLQNQRGGHLIDDAAMFLAGVAGFVEDMVSLAGGQPLVPEVDGEAGQLAEFGGKGLSFGGLRACIAGEMHGIAYHNAYDAKAPAEARQGAQIVAAVVMPLQRQHRLRGQAQFVRDGNTDAAVADVEAKIAGMGGRFQLPAPCL